MAAVMPLPLFWPMAAGALPAHTAGAGGTGGVDELTGGGVLPAVFEKMFAVVEPACAAPAWIGAGLAGGPPWG